MTAALSTLSRARRECEICPRDAVGRLHIPQRGGRYHLCARCYVRARQDGTGKVVVGDPDILPDLLAVVAAKPAQEALPKRSSSVPRQEGLPPTPKRPKTEDLVSRYIALTDAGTPRYEALNSLGISTSEWRRIRELAGDTGMMPPTLEEAQRIYDAARADGLSHGAALRTTGIPAVEYHQIRQSDHKPQLRVTTEMIQGIRKLYRQGVPWKDIMNDQRVYGERARYIRSLLDEEDHAARGEAIAERAKPRHRIRWIGLMLEREREMGGSISASLNKVAQRLGCPPATVYAWTTGTAPKERLRARIREVYGVQVAA